MALIKVPTPTSFILNGAAVPPGTLAISPGGSLNTIVITGSNFKNTTKFIVSDDRDTDSFPGMPVTPTFVSVDGTTMSGSFTAVGPTPAAPPAPMPPPEGLPPALPAPGAPVLIDITITTTGVINGVQSGASVQEAIPS